MSTKRGEVHIEFRLVSRNDETVPLGQPGKTATISFLLLDEEPGKKPLNPRPNLTVAAADDQKVLKFPAAKAVGDDVQERRLKQATERVNLIDKMLDRLKEEGDPSIPVEGRAGLWPAARFRKVLHAISVGSESEWPFRDDFYPPKARGR